jgi:hypothetical protein
MSPLQRLGQNLGQAEMADLTDSDELGHRADRQSGYSSFRHARGSGGCGFGVRSSRKPKYGATNGSGADTE